LTPYGDQSYQPLAPVASLILRTLDGRDQIVSNVPALLDTGADVTVLPRWATQQLGLIPRTDESIKLAGFDGSIQSAESAQLEVKCVRTIASTTSVWWPPSNLSARPTKTGPSIGANSSPIAPRCSAATFVSSSSFVAHAVSLKSIFHGT
jgi:Aspartyl protease